MLQMMTESEFRSRIKDGRAVKDELEEAFREAFRSIGWHDAASAMGATFDGLVDDGDVASDFPDEDTAYDEACNAIEAIEKALNIDHPADQRIAAAQAVIDKWNGDE